MKVGMLHMTMFVHDDVVVKYDDVMMIRGVHAAHKHWSVCLCKS